MAAGTVRHFGVSGDIQMDETTVKQILEGSFDGELGIDEIPVWTDAHYFAIADVTKERIRQDRKFGPQRHHPAEWMVILGEEYGAACKEACQTIDAPLVKAKGLDEERLYRELTEVAAVAVAIMEQIREGGW